MKDYLTLFSTNKAVDTSPRDAPQPQLERRAVCNQCLSLTSPTEEWRFDWLHYDTRTGAAWPDPVPVLLRQAWCADCEGHLATMAYYDVASWVLARAAALTTGGMVESDALAQATNEAITAYSTPKNV